eukprot:3077284-Rhodomonas_salina.2
MSVLARLGRYASRFKGTSVLDARSRYPQARGPRSVIPKLVAGEIRVKQLQLRATRRRLSPLQYYPPPAPVPDIA